MNYTDKICCVLFLFFILFHFCVKARRVRSTDSNECAAGSRVYDLRRDKKVLFTLYFVVFYGDRRTVHSETEKCFDINER